MKRFCYFISLASLAALSAAVWATDTHPDFGLFSECRHSASTFSCVEVIDNYDGDTFKVNIPKVHPLLGREITVRVNGVDTPEMRSSDPCEVRAAERAKEFTRDFLLKSRSVSLINIGRDKYFRVLADVHGDGKSLAQELIRRRLGVSYDGGTKDHVNWCRF